MDWWDIYNTAAVGEDLTGAQQEAQSGNIWSSADLYGIGIGSGGISESEFTTYDEGAIVSDLSTFGMVDDFTKWHIEFQDFTDIGEGIPGGALIQYKGSEWANEEQSYLKELSETYRTMSTDIMGTRAKTFSDKTKMRSTAGKTNLVGSGTINRASRTMDKAHEESVFDTYSDFLEDKSGIVSDIAGAREDWWDFNQGIMSNLDYTSNVDPA